jgi:hypothetical protein
VTVERALVERADDDAGGFPAEAHRVMAGKFLRRRATHDGRNPRHRADEIFDHAVRVGVIDVEAVEFAIGRKIDPGLPLDVEDDASRVDDRLFARQGGEPIRDRVGADGRRENAGGLGQFRDGHGKWKGVERGGSITGARASLPGRWRSR